MTKMVKMMSAKLKMGSPMICMYLLGNPDHYTSHKFVNKVRKSWNEDFGEELPEKVAIFNTREKSLECQMCMTTSTSQWN